MQDAKQTMRSTNCGRPFPFPVSRMATMSWYRRRRGVHGARQFRCTGAEGRGQFVEIEGEVRLKCQRSSPRPNCDSRTR